MTKKPPAKINSLAAVDTGTEASNTSLASHIHMSGSGDTTVSDDVIDKAVTAFMDIEIPDDPDSRRIHTKYVASIYNINTTAAQPCIVCGESH